ncbi:MAG: hypothetical protein K2Q01_04930 [Rickettsiales bacterium]|nr:hypothetical protein [Rickettsiales bacterium]
MRFLFRPRPINSLQQAAQLVSAAMQIIWQHKRSTGFRPNEEDFRTLNQLRVRLWQAYNEMEYIIGSLHQRMRGEAESPEDDK